MALNLSLDDQDLPVLSTPPPTMTAALENREDPAVVRERHSQRFFDQV